MTLPPELTKRMQAILAVLDVGDTEMAEGLAAKLAAHAGEPAVAAILEHLRFHRYADARSGIERLLAEGTRLVAWEDPEVVLLEAEAERIAADLAAVEAERAEVDHRLARFQAAYHEALGERIRDVLRLRRLVREREAERDPARRSPFEDAKRDSERFERDFETEKEKARETEWDLTGDEQKEMKSLFRQAAKKCHPDAVPPQFRDAAGDLFRRLRAAHDAGDLATVRKLAEQVAAGMFEAGAESGEDAARRKERLRARVEALRGALAAARSGLDAVKGSATFRRLGGGADWESLFAEQAERLEEEARRLRNELETADPDGDESAPPMPRVPPPPAAEKTTPPPPRANPRSEDRPPQPGAAPTEPIAPHAPRTTAIPRVAVTSAAPVKAPASLCRRCSTPLVSSHEWGVICPKCRSWWIAWGIGIGVAVAAFLFVEIPSKNTGAAILAGFGVGLSYLVFRAEVESDLQRLLRGEPSRPPKPGSVRAPAESPQPPRSPARAEPRAVPNRSAGTGSIGGPRTTAPAPATPRPVAPTGSATTPSGGRRWFVVLGGIAVVWWFVVHSRNTERSTVLAPSGPQPASSAPAAGPFFAPEVAFPESGSVVWSDRSPRLAPFTVRTSGDADFVIKLVHAFGDREVARFYIRGGDSKDFEVPLGTYVLKYACGERWFGDEFLFGPSTRYSKASTTFEFAEAADGYEGFTVTLYPVVDGNLRTVSIAAEQF
jgi:hypothetical protein